MREKIKKMMYLVLGMFVMVCMLETVNVEAASLNKSKTTLYVGKTATLKLTGTEAESWTSNNKKVATVDSDGMVTAKSKGTATITCNGVNGKKYTCKVTVKDPSLNKTKVTINIGKKTTLKLTGATAKKWSSTNKKVVSVNSNGKITPKKKGNATITCKADNGKKYTCKVSVKNPVGETSSNGKYTAKGAIKVYRAIMEANGMKWDPKLKGNWDKTIGKYPIEEWYLHMDNYTGSSWGAGWTSLDKDNVIAGAYSTLKNCSIGSNGKPWKSYYLEVTASNKDKMYVISWH